MKKFLVLFLCMILSLSMVACGGGDSESSDSTQEPIVINIASDDNNDSPSVRAAMQFAEDVEEATEGRVEVEVFPDAAMGNEREIAEGISMGTIEMAIMNTGLLATYDENFYALELPFLFENDEERYGFYDGEGGEYLEKSLKEKSGIEILAWLDGANRILCSKEPVDKISDMSNMKFRCVENNLNLSVYENWGSTAVPMSFSEVYTGLQQGTIDGVDTSILFITPFGFPEVADHFTLSNHQAMNFTVITNGQWFESLPEDIQEIIKEHMKSFETNGRENTQADAAVAVEKMKEAGMEEHILSEDALAEFIEKSEPVIEEYRSVVDAELYDMLGL